MIGFIRDKIDGIFGHGAYSTAVPVLDGPMQPNHALDEAEVLFEAPELDNLLSVPEGVVFSSGAALMRLAGENTPTEITRFAAPITCLAVDGAGALAVGLDGQGMVIRGGAHDGMRIDSLGGGRFICPTAALFEDADTLLVTVGSDTHRLAQWKHDLMMREASGTVWRIDLRTGKAECLATGLGFPYGIAKDAKGIVVSESWAHRLIRLTANGGKPRHEVVLGDIAGYPARITPSEAGGYWLAVFAPRNQMVEFVLRENRFRRDMIETVDPRYWIAPALASNISFKEVLQGGAVKQMGILKPWAPALSYGLVAHLDADFQPQASWHSRADGHRHGVTSMCEQAGRLIVGAKGAGMAMVFDSETVSKERF